MGGIYEEARAALHAVWIRRWVALGIAWGLCLLGWLAVSQIPNQYESVARVFVEMRTILPTSDGMLQQSEQEKDIDRVRQTLTSAVNLQKVVRATDLGAGIAGDREIASRVASLHKVIKITEQQENLFEISTSLNDPRTARAVVQKLIDLFVEDNLANDRNSTSQSLAFLDQQLTDRSRQLADAQARRQEFQARFMSGLPGTGSLDERISQARTQIATVESELSGAQSRLNAVNAQLSGTAASIAGSAGGSVAGPARARLSAIEGQLSEARARGWTDQHPDVVALNRQLSAARSAASGEPVRYSGGSSATANPLYTSLRAQQAEAAARVAELSQRRGTIDGQVSQLEAKLASDPRAASDQAQLESEISGLKQQYNQLFQSREQMRLRSQIQTNTDAVKFSVIDPPTQPTAPTAPNRPLLLAGVLVVGLGGGVAGAFALSRLRTRFETSARLERISGMPVIGSVGEVLTQAQIAMRRRRLVMFAGGAGALAVAFIALLGVEFVQRGMMA